MTVCIIWGDTGSGYFGVDVETVRDVIETYLPNLEAVLRTYAGE